MSITHTKTYLSKELKLLIACCQTEPSEEEIDFIRISSSTINHQLVIKLANQHGILPLIYKSLRKLSPIDHAPSGNALGVQPSSLIHELKVHYQTIVQRNMLMSSELIRIMKLLEANGIEALVFKGPSLAQMAYGDITLRQYVDLDVLVRKKDIYKVDTLLKDREYQRSIKLTSIQEKFLIKFKHDIGLYHPKSGVHFEMHWSLMNEDYPLQIELDTFWENPQTVLINQQEVKTFPTEELLLYLCIHGSKHLWERIEWIKDIDLLIRTQDIKWGKIIKEVESSGFETMLYLGLSLTKQLFKTSMPENITNRISNMQVLDILSNFVLQNWQTPQNAFHQTAAMLKLFPSIKERLIYLHKILIKPSFNEYRYIDLPKGFYWIYYFLRPYLLMKKYLTKQG